MAGENACCIAFALIVVTWLLQPALTAYVMSLNKPPPPIMTVQSPQPAPVTSRATVEKVRLSVTNCTIVSASMPSSTEANHTSDNHMNGTYEVSPVPHHLLVCALPGVYNVSTVAHPIDISPILLYAHAYHKPMTEAEHMIFMHIVLKWSLIIIGMCVAIGYLLAMAIRPCCPEGGNRRGCASCCMPH